MRIPFAEICMRSGNWSWQDVYVINFVLKNTLISHAFLVSNKRRSHYCLFTASDIMRYYVRRYRAHYDRHLKKINSMIFSFFLVQFLATNIRAI